MKSWLVHYSAPLSGTMGFLAFSLSGVLVTLNGGPALPLPQQAVFAALALGCGTLLVVYYRSHLRDGMCTRCFAGMSVTPSEDAARHSRALRTVHRLTGLPFWGLQVLAMAVVSALLAVTMWQPWLGGPLAGALFARTLRSLDLHQRFQPWCPWCDHGRGRGRDEEPAPAGPSSPSQSR